MSLQFSKLADAIEDATGCPFCIDHTQPLSGGCVHRACAIVGTSGQRYFLKFNDTDTLPVFATEANALQFMGKLRTVRFPQPIFHGLIDNHAVLVLEFVDFCSGNIATWQLLGQQLAELHQTSAPAFGWSEDNWIGSTPQPNTWQADWAAFFRDRRIGHQLQVAKDNGLRIPETTRLLDRIPSLLGSHHPPPALVHGDLWAGNVGFCNGNPVLYDPAIHFADRECDLAMTRLFGGFPDAFYTAYEQAWPLPHGAHFRLPLYQLYHILNHANLFGGSYLHQANSIIGSLMSH
jgi:fructosamine-3-kinase